MEVVRIAVLKASVPIMYGCNTSVHTVLYRMSEEERSRNHEAIIAEIKDGVRWV